MLKMDEIIEQEKEENINDSPNAELSFDDIPPIQETNDNSAIIIKSDSENHKYFYTEIMSTAGPRKSFKEDAHEGDFDLGEDVVGCFTKKDKTYFWLLDGTSDNPVFKTTDGTELFSSRLLAQEVAWHIQKALWNNEKEELNSEDILKSSFEDIQKNWKEKFDKLSESDNQILAEILKDRKQMLVSTTVIFGIIDLNGHLDVGQIGDSYIITKPAQEFKENTGRLFVIASKTENNDSIKIELNPFEDTRCQHYKCDNIKTIIAASDGISKNTIKWLNILPNVELRNENLRKTISAVKQKTCDDKAVCIIQICEDV